MSQHAILAPSGAVTWMQCAGSAAMQRGIPDKPSEYSDQGTAAHLLASTALEIGNDAWFFIGSIIHVGTTDEFDGAIWADDLSQREFEGFVIRRSYLVDQELADQVAKYVSAVREFAGDGILMAEQRVSIEAFTGEPGACGTTDAGVVRGDELQVHDLKFGMGEKVYAKRNRQLLIYALGLRASVELMYGPFKRIRLVIHQPRLDHLDEWDCTSEELDFFAEEMKQPAMRALALYQHAGTHPKEFVYRLNMEETLVPSESACRWCRAKADCPAAAKFVSDMTMAYFDDAVDGQPIKDITVSVADYEDASLLGRKMDAIGQIEDWCKAIRAEVERQLFAGKLIPGYKIVQGKRGNRSWTDLAAIDELLKTMRMPIEDRYKMTLHSPPAIEKALKATPRRWARVLKANLIEQRDGLPSVAPESDKRPTWTPPDTAADFSPIIEEELV